MKDIISSVIGIFLAFLMLGITPLYYIGTIQWAQAETQAIAYTTNLVDEVIDTKRLNDQTLSEYNLNMASLSSYYTYTIERQIKVVNPDPLNAGSTYTSYITVDDNKEYETGDLIVVSVKPAGMSFAQSIADNILGLSVPRNGFTIPGRVR